jgi:His/Glu/Gln/Arg/opine family amino acid ABC transporter permease subunit
LSEFFGLITHHLSFLLSGYLVTIKASALPIGLATVGGLIVAVLRTYRGVVASGILAFAVGVLRSIPLLTLVFWGFYALPVLFTRQISPLTAGVITVAAQYAASTSEIFRAGSGSISPGQRMAAGAIGMTSLQALRRVILPQAAIRILPPFGSQLASLVKDTSILSAAAVGYVLLTMPLLLVSNGAYRWLASRVAPCS